MSQELSDVGMVRRELANHRGIQNAITSRELAKRLEMSPRRVRRVISWLVENGELIGASVEGVDGGYYLIESAQELEETRAVLRSRAAKIFARDAALRKAWERAHGQAVQPLLPNLTPYPLS